MAECDGSGWCSCDGVRCGGDAGEGRVESNSDEERDGGSDSTAVVDSDGGADGSSLLISSLFWCAHARMRSSSRISSATSALQSLLVVVREVEEKSEGSA